MSTLRVSSITNVDDNGPVEFPNGLTISSGKQITGNVSLSGVCTSTSYSGNASSMSFPGKITNSKTIGFILIG